MTEFSTFKINFRSADAANHVNRDPGGSLGVTRRAYSPKIYKLREYFGGAGELVLNFQENDKSGNFRAKMKYA